MSDKYAETKELMGHMTAVKMSINSHKGAIEECSDEFLIAKLREEVDELELAIDQGDYTHILEEAADVQNYLVGMVFKEIEKYRGRKKL